MTDIALATVPLATAAGWVYTIDTDKDGTNRCELSKPLTGGTHQSGLEIRAVGLGSTVAIATGNALAALNNQRGHRYGFGVTTSVNKDDLGTVEVQDAT
jgi:hypothetical protein